LLVTVVKDGSLASAADVLTVVAEVVIGVEDVVGVADVLTIFAVVVVESGTLVDVGDVLTVLVEEVAEGVSEEDNVLLSCEVEPFTLVLIEVVKKLGVVGSTLL
jgi:hypothetical protein